MAGLGMLMLLTALLGLLLRMRGRLYETRWYQRLVLCMGPSGLVALLAGWITTEVGRQPWTVYGVLRTADSLSPIDAQQAGVSLLIFVMVYFLVFGTGVYLHAADDEARTGGASRRTRSAQASGAAQSRARRAGRGVTPCRSIFP